MKKICVIGSFNVDMICLMDNFPGVGETVLTNTFDLLVGGGKGANQAVALGRLGADVRMVGMLGDKFYGPEYLQVLADNGVKNDTVGMKKGEYPGIAFVGVNKNTDNQLYVYSGANKKVTPEFIDENWGKISSCHIFLLQFEIPYETNLYVAKKLHGLGKIVILDPAPAVGFTHEIFKYVDYATPNEVELGQIVGMKVESHEDFRAAGEKLLAMGTGTIIAKAGKKGAYIIKQGEMTHYPPIDVVPVDPTAAGDSFNAGFAYGLSRGLSEAGCAALANGVAGLAVTKVGAQSGMPTLDELKDFIDIEELI
jgi:ribokinase